MSVISSSGSSYSTSSPGSPPIPLSPSKQSSPPSIAGRLKMLAWCNYLRSMYNAAVMPTPPTVTVGGANAASTIAGAVNHPITESQFVLLGGNALVTGAGYAAGYYAPSVRQGATTPGPTNGGWFIAFTYDGTQFDIGIKAFANSYFRVWVNGQPHIVTPVQAAADGSSHWINVLFAGRARRNIMVEACGTPSGSPTTFNGFNFEPTGAVSAPTNISSALINLVGDSFINGEQGQAAGTENKAMGFCHLLGRLLGVRCTDNGAGSTGFLIGSANGSPYRQRLAADVFPYNPDLVIFHASTNDSGLVADGGANLTSEVAQCIQQTALNLPNALIIVTGLLYQANFSGAFNTVQAAVKAGAQQMNVPFVDTQSPVKWSFGTGRVGTVTGDGPADFYMSPDASVHPSTAGHVNIAEQLASAIALLIGTTT